MYLSQRVRATALPVIDTLAQLADELRAAGQDVLSLGQGMTDFPSPPEALAAAGAALADPATHRYSPDPGLPELRAAMAAKWQRDAGVAVDPDREIIVTAGGNQAVVLALLACADPATRSSCRRRTISTTRWPSTSAGWSRSKRRWPRRTAMP